jgi:hypothetical protein
MNKETIKNDIKKVEEKSIFLIGSLKNWAILNPKKAIFLLGFIVGFILGTLF